ncbi:cysteine proteinase inhibitor A-like [Rutidosis leptorrhynchoides]|uniref:cysteine proteinase inhibitor A-like n=1 Tax=Rutidosis leptorrhynchoides TaxID=125765 RepID=UPI003A99227A
MNHKTCLIITALFLFVFFESGLSRLEKTSMMKLGGIRDITQQRGVNDIEIESLARIAVDQHNKKENSFLKFARLLKAKEQVVAGKMYYLTMEAADAAGNLKVYETKIWVKPWMNFKQVQEFKVANDPII